MANVREAVRSLQAAKQRNLLALLGIVIGIGSVIAMISVGNIVGEETLRQFKELGTDLITVHPGWHPEGKPAPPLSPKVALELPVRTRSVELASPVIVTGAAMVFNGRQLTAGVLGVTESFANLNKLRLRSGRLISDLDRFRQFAVVGAEALAAAGVYGGDELIGMPIRIGDRVFTIIGVLGSSPRSSMISYDVNYSVLIPLSTASRVVVRNGVDTVTARLREHANHQRAATEVRDYFELHSPGIGVQVTTAEELIAGMDKQAHTFTLLLGAVGSISLVVGGVGVMNVMLVSVSERRREIGIRRALGARRRDIQAQFLTEALILSLLGGLFGVLAGVGVSYLIAAVNQWQFLMSMTAIVLGVGVSTLIGLFFGFYPAYQAARLDPITALRAD